MTFDEAVRTFGLPGAMLVLALITGAKGTWRWGRDADTAAKLVQDQATRTVAAMQLVIDYSEARRVEERNGRLAAEKRLDDILPAASNVVELAAQLRKDLSRAAPAPTRSRRVPPSSDERTRR